MKFTLSLFFLLVLGTHSFCQAITTETVRPFTTDAAIPETGDLNLPHYTLKPDVDTMNTLVVFLPGTSRQPSNYLFIEQEVAKLGYHVIGLTYQTNSPVNPLCKGTGDVTCHWRARMETIDGIDRHPDVSISVTNSVLNRLQKLLQWLVNNRASRGWGQFYSGGQIQWEKIIVTGHSQGASLSGILGQQFPVKRVVMFSVMDFLENGSIPNWVDNTTGHEKYFAFIHPKDEQVPFTAAQIGWEKLGMTQHGSMVNIDCNSSPYNNSHLLITNYVPTVSLTDIYHNGTSLDSYFSGNTVFRNTLAEAISYLFKK